ncbi:MAG TPA: sugar ABC transporter substrate-binding protein [Solirubrobacteraceae bacterium]|nr:sugar ABC transporter substrate-binding protein [Solirubrobacteraceae bacterium]
MIEKFVRLRSVNRFRIGIVGALVAAIAIGMVASTSAASAKGKHLKLVFLSFAATNNSYDAPMLAAAKAEASKLGASLQVMDANNSPTAQYSDFQNALAEGGVNGIITQPIESTNLIPLVGKAVKKGIKVVNVDQVMGKKYTTSAVQVKGLSGNVTFDPWELGSQWGALTVQACEAKHLSPCNIGYLYDIQQSTLDVALHAAFINALKKDPSASIVDTGQDFFTPTTGESAVQTMMSAHPEINLIAASDQGIEGAADASSAAKDVLVGFGASQAGIAGVKSGRWFGTVAQDPASEGKDGVLTLVNAIRNNKNYPGQNPLNKLPDKGVVTKSDAGKFKGEWAG